MVTTVFKAWRSRDDGRKGSTKEFGLFACRESARAACDADAGVTLPWGRNAAWAKSITPEGSDVVYLINDPDIFYVTPIEVQP